MRDEAATCLKIASNQDQLTEPQFCHSVTKTLPKNFPRETFTHRQNAFVGHMQSEHLATLSIPQQQRAKLFYRVKPFARNICKNVTPLQFHGPGHEPPPVPTYIYTCCYTDWVWTLVTTISCLMWHLRGSPTCGCMRA